MPRGEREKIKYSKIGENIMNKANLRLVFQRYIDNFELINNKEHDENFKWELAEMFQTFDLEAKDFSGMLYDLWKKSDSFIDNRYHLAFYALCVYSKEEPETVRDMFKMLFKNEKMSCDEKQDKIDKFIDKAEELRGKYLSHDDRYKNTQKSVMMYLFYRYPNENYLYQAVKAKNFASCIDFYEDWGSMTNFKLESFYRMCDFVVEEIENNINLLETHNSRYYDKNRKLHNDENYHILATDIIYSSQTYGLFTGLPFVKIDSKSRKLYLERCAKAKELDEAVNIAEIDFEYLTEAKDFINTYIKNGDLIFHKTNGEGIIENVDGTFISVNFEKLCKTIKLSLTVAVSNGLLCLKTDELTDNLKEYIDILKRERDIPKALERAVEERKPYLEYLD